MQCICFYNDCTVKSVSANSLYQIKQKASTVASYTKVIAVICAIVSGMIVIFLPMLLFFRKRVKTHYLNKKKFDLCHVREFN
jgi:hypothetical protein